MAGYSDTPLPNKLGIRTGFRVDLLNEPTEVHVKLRAAMTGCEPAPAPDGILDFALVFSTSRAELGRTFRKVSRALAPAGMVWAAWPKKSSDVPSDLDEHVVREIGLRAGLVDVKVAALTDVWSGLKFVRRVKDRESLP